MTEPLHLDDEVLSSLADGEEDAAALAHAAACAECGTRLAGMRAVVAAVGRAPDPPTAASREAAIAAALGAAETAAFSPWTEPVADLRTRRARRDRRLPQWIAVAAVVAGLLVAIPVLSRGATSKKSSSTATGTTAIEPTASGPATNEQRGSAEDRAAAPVAPTAPSVAAPKAGSFAVGPIVAGGDLGPLSNPREMAILAAIDFELRRPAGPIGTPPPNAASTSPVSAPCAAAAAAAAPSGAQAVYGAAVVWNGTPATVTGYLVPPGPMTFVIASPGDCRVLAVAQA